MQTDLTLGDAAKAIGVSADTLRRWDRSGQAAHGARRAQPAAASRPTRCERLSSRPLSATRPATALSARNRFPGVVRSVEVDGVMALVEIEAGPFLITSAVTRDAVEELGLAPGVEATAAVKATSVMVHRPMRLARARPRRRGRRVRQRRRARRTGAAAARGLGRRVAVGRADGLQQAVRGRRREALARRLRRAGRPDPPGRQARRLRRGQHPAARGARAGGAARHPGRVRHQRAGDRGRRRRHGRSSRVDDLAKPGIDLAIGAESVPVGAYTREVLGRPARHARARRSSPTCAPRSPTSRASSASSRRAPPTPASST